MLFTFIDIYTYTYDNILKEEKKHLNRINRK